MTTISEIDQKCAMCGETSKLPIIGSTNSFGYPDLDLRPPEMQRSTIRIWVLECPHCGYVARDIKRKTALPKEFIEKDEYRNCDGIRFKSDLAKKFYKSHMISTQLNDLTSSFFDILHCAWACDDSEDSENAILARKTASELAYALIQMNDDEKNSLILIRADLLRRSGQFEKLIEEYENITLGEEIENKVIKFQIEKARENDTACYTVEDVV